jgi:DNA-binding transcriptional MocR family regulator
MATVERGVAFAPGDVFFPGAPARPFMRLAFSTMAPELIPDTVRVIGEMLSTHMLRRSFVKEGPAECVQLV